MYKIRYRSNNSTESFFGVVSGFFGAGTKRIQIRRLLFLRKGCI